MHGTLRKRAADAREIDRPIGDATDHLVANVLTDIARALWPRYTAQNIATEINKMRSKDDECAVRTVERYIEGSREWSSEAMAVIVAEIMRRHGMKNLKVAKRTSD